MHTHLRETREGETIGQARVNGVPSSSQSTERSSPLRPRGCLLNGKETADDSVLILMVVQDNQAGTNTFVSYDTRPNVKKTVPSRTHACVFSMDSCSYHRCFPCLGCRFASLHSPMFPSSCEEQQKRTFHPAYLRHLSLHLPPSLPSSPPSIILSLKPTWRPVCPMSSFGACSSSRESHTLNSSLRRPWRDSSSSCRVTAPKHWW